MRPRLRWPSWLPNRVPPGLLGAIRAASPLAWTLGVLGVLGALGAWRLGWDELAVVATGCAVVLGLASAFLFGRSSVQAILELEPRRVSVGDESVARIAATHVGTRALLPSRIEAEVTGHGVMGLDVPALRTGEHVEEIFVIRAARRGLVSAGPARVVRGDPLGLFHREVALTPAVELYVHPRTVRLPAMSTGWLRDLEGRANDELSNSDVAFHALREYAPGDDRRHVHWRTSARLGRLMVRQFVDTRRAHLGLVLSTDSEDYAGDDEFELAVSVAASIGRSALTEDQTLTVVAGTELIPGSRIEPFLDAMCIIEPSRTGRRGEGSTSGVAPAVARARARFRRASSVVVVSGSGSSVGELRAAAQRLPQTATVTIVRTELGAQASRRRVGQMIVVSVGALEDLASGLRAPVGARR